MAAERSLVIAKPDAVQRGLASEVLGRFERRGLKIVGLKMIQIDRALAQRHYAVHEGKPFYEGLVDYITSGPSVIAAIEGPDAIAAIRSTVGATNPAAAAPGTIRGDYGLTVGRNLVHASDSPENGQSEVSLFFQDGELLTYTRANDPWILEE